MPITCLLHSSFGVVHPARSDNVLDPSLSKTSDPDEWRLSPVITPTDCYTAIVSNEVKAHLVTAPWHCHWGERKEYYGGTFVMEEHYIMLIRSRYILECKYKFIHNDLICGGFAWSDSIRVIFCIIIIGLFNSLLLNNLSHFCKCMIKLLFSLDNNFLSFSMFIFSLHDKKTISRESSTTYEKKCRGSY